MVSPHHHIDQLQGGERPLVGFALGHALHSFLRTSSQRSSHFRNASSRRIARSRRRIVCTEAPSSCAQALVWVTSCRRAKHDRLSTANTSRGLASERRLAKMSLRK